MVTKKKEKIVEGLKETFSRSEVGVLTDYRGLTTAELNEVRKKLREAGVEYHVVKNSLAQLAVKNSGKEGLAATFEGPVAVAFGFSESTDAAKVLVEYIRASKSVLSIKGGFLSDRVLTARDVENLARLPAREVLLAQVLAGMQSPIYGLVNVLAGPIRNIMGVLQARIKQMEAE